MLSPAIQLFPAPERYLPRSRPGTGPTSKRDVTLHAEVTHLSSKILDLEKEQRIQLTRISEIQRELDEIKRLLKERR